MAQDRLFEDTLSEALAEAGVTELDPPLMAAAVRDALAAAVCGYFARLQRKVAPWPPAEDAPARRKPGRRKKAAARK